MHRGEKEVEMKWVKWNRCHNKQEGKEERQEEGNKIKKALNLKVGGRGIYRKTEKYTERGKKKDKIRKKWRMKG